MSLHSLASNKSPKAAERPQKKSSKRWRDKLLAWFPLYLLIGFMLLAWLLFGHAFIPAREVAMTTVVTQKSELNSSESATFTEETGAASSGRDPFLGEVIFQSSGWIEADPYVTRATTLLDGVVRDVFVLEGETVEKGQLLASLISEDAEIALLHAEASLAESNAHVEREASRVQQAEARVERHALQVAAFRAELEILFDDATRFEAVGAGAYSARDVKQAALRADAGKAELASLQAEAKELESEWATTRKEQDSAQRRVERADATLRQAQLNLSRTQIHSPITGVVQALYVTPGRKRMLGMDDPESATIAILYDPEKLQARIDVPLEEAAQLSLGQPVIVRSNLIPNREFEGFVTRIAGMADIQRNTLQVKVAVQEPDPRMRPEMLCRAEFLALPTTMGSSLRGASDGIQRVTVFVAEAALIERQGDRASVWSLDQTGEKAEKRSIRIGDLSREGHVEVVDGLRPGDPIILNPPTDLASGERVRASLTIDGGGF
jgi:RND family efflux transporter MFP subunit